MANFSNDAFRLKCPNTFIYHATAGWQYNSEYGKYQLISSMSVSLKYLLIFIVSFIKIQLLLLNSPRKQTECSLSGPSLICL